MATGENCYGLEAGINRLDNVGSEERAAFDASKAAKGKETFNNILQPIRNAREAEKTATGTEKVRLMDEIHAHYAEGKSPGSKTTKATQDISKAIQSDSDVQQYIRNMSPSEFGKARTEIKNTFGGDQARMMEHQYVNKMDDYEAALESSGKMIPSIKERIATTRSRGVMSDSDLDVMRGLEEYLSLGDDAFAQGKSRGTYNSLGRKLGDDITQDIFAEKVAQQMDTAAEKLANKTLTSRVSDVIFGEKLNDAEKMLLSDYERGILKPTGDSLEAARSLVKKLDESAFKPFRDAVSAIDELPNNARYKVFDKAGKTITRGLAGKTKDIATSKTAILSGAAFVLFGIPAYIIWSVGTVTNVAEMVDLFKQFNSDKSPEALMRHFFNNEEMLVGGKVIRPLDITKQFFESLNQYDKNMQEWYDVPLLGTWLKLITSASAAIFDTPDAIRGNYANIYGDMEARGLLKRVTDPNNPYYSIGFEPKTAEERKEFFKNNPEALFHPDNDKKFIEENSPWGEPTRVFKGATELSPAAVMALYLGQADAYSKLGVSNSDLNDQAFADKVKQYGEANDNRGTGTPSAQGTSDVIGGGNKEDWINRVMEVQGIEREAAEKFVNSRIQGEIDKAWERNGEKISEEQAIQKALGGGSGGSGGSGKTLTGQIKQDADYMKEHGANTLGRDQQRSVMNALSDKGKVDIKAVKEQSGMSVTDMLNANEAGTKAGFEDHVKQQVKNENRIDKTDYTQMRENDKQAARDAARAAVGCT